MSAPSDTPLIARHDGVGLFSAAETILKGLVESEAEVDLLSGARWGVFGRVFDLLADETVAEVCRLHGLRVVATPDERRSLMLAAQAAQAGRSAIALVPNARLGQTSALLERLLARPRPGSLAILFEDAPGDVPTMCPRHVSRALDLPTLEAGDLAELRSAVGLLPRLTRASGRPVALIVRRSILHQHDTMEVVPNRVLRPLEAVLVGRRRRPRRVSVETGNTLRLVRRLELNTIRCLPSPGERVPVGFVVVGAAAPAMRHLTTVLQLTERVPIVRLTVVNPIDDAIVERLLARCVNVIVLEARPGVVEADILEIAEAMRRGDHRPAAIWGRQLPPTTPDGVPGRLRPDDAVHPSILARRIVHLLHLIRPTMQIASRLVPERRSDEVDVAERRDDFGAAAARQVVRAIVDETDVWLRERAPFAELDVAPTALALDGVAAPGAPARIVNTEIWDRAEFLDGGLSALRQVARSDQPWLIIVCDVSSDDDREDLERLMRGAVPGERADRVRIEVVDLTDRATVRQTIRDIVVRDGSTMLIVRDGEPPRYDTVAVARAAAETDRLGYDPIQRLIRRTDAVCELEAPPLPNLGAARPESELRSGFRADAMRSGRRRQVQIRVRPLYEQIEVVRTKAPASGDAVGVGLPVPRPIASQQTHWRAHLAGYRGDAPGFVASILADAGGTMGYHVRVTFDARPIGHGRRAWAQVTFSRPVSGPGEVRLTGRVPYGEADLLLGVDPAEAMRAVGPDRQLRVASADHTACVINTGLHGDEMDLGVVAPSAEAIETAFATVSREALGLAVDVAAACRARFSNDRLSDCAILGAAFQRGLIPLTSAAIDGALERAESRGCGRAREAFQFGRALGADPHGLMRAALPPPESATRLARRLSLAFGRDRGRLRRLLERTLERTPGLTETDAGRLARRHLVAAAWRCVGWGGFAHAERFADAIVALYQVDRGDRGRALTRLAVLPLADAMLIRDFVYVARLHTSVEVRRRIRQRFNVKSARGDTVTRRFLTRFEIVAAGRRLRWDVRTSDWLIRIGSRLGRFIPLRWRGSSSEREIRVYIMDLVRRATAGAEHGYDRWVAVLTRVNEEARRSRFRGLSVADVRRIAEPDAPTDPTTADQSAAVDDEG